jgi:hypothetical protein
MIHLSGLFDLQPHTVRELDVTLNDDIVSQTQLAFDFFDV